MKNSADPLKESLFSPRLLQRHAMGNGTLRRQIFGYPCIGHRPETLLHSTWFQCLSWLLCHQANQRRLRILLRPLQNMPIHDLLLTQEIGQQKWQSNDCKPWTISQRLKLRWRQCPKGWCMLVAAVFSPKVATENSPPVSGRANSKLQIFGIGAVAGNKPDALKEMRQGQSGEGIEGDRFDPRLTKRGAEHIGYRAQGWF